MPPILLRCLGLRLLKLLSIAALLAGVLMLADHRVSAQAGKPAPAAADDKGSADDKGDDQQATPAGDDKQGAKPGADADESEEPADQPEEPAESPAAIADTGNYMKRKVDRKQMKEKEVKIKAIAHKGTFEGGEQADFDEFFQTYFFPSWADPFFIPKVQEQRAKLRDFLKQSRSGQFHDVHDHLLALSMRFLKILAETNFHPAARYNAVLAIGELNDSEPSGSTPAVPHAGALAVLMEWFKKGPSDYFKVAALRGLLRHCTLGIASAQARDTEVIPALLEVAKSRPPKDRTPEGHAWMRTLAIESLAALGTPGVAGVAAVGPNGVIDAMVKIVGEPASSPGSLSVRCAAARALGSINPAPQFSTTPSQMAALLRQLTADFCVAELDRHEKFPDTRLFREEVRQRLNDVKIALQDKDGGAAADLAAEVRSLSNKLDVRAPQDDAARAAQDDAMTADIEKALSKLRVATPAAAAAAASSAPRGAAVVP